MANVITGLRILVSAMLLFCPVFSPIAREYEALKLELWKKYEHDRDAYTDAKTDFIQKWTTAARTKYGCR